MKILQNYNELMCSGIYKIINLVNSKCYVGSSTVVYHRLKRHKAELAQNIHGNKHLQNAYNKYKSTNFIAVLLHTCPKEELKAMEIYYMSIQCTELYNKMSPERTEPMPEEIKHKISETLKRKYSEGLLDTYRQQHKWRTVYVWDLQGNYINSWESPMICAKALGLGPKAALGCLNKKTKSFGHKYYASYENKFDETIYTVKLTNTITGEELRFFKPQHVIDYFGDRFNSLAWYVEKDKLYREIFKVSYINGYKPRKIKNTRRGVKSVKGE